MKEPMIVLDVFGKRAEMTETQGREMLRLLKQVFGELERERLVTIPFPAQPLDVRPYQPIVPPPTQDPWWLPKVICGSPQHTGAFLT